MEGFSANPEINHASAALFNCLARRAFFRLAAFLWMTPLDAALSITAEVADSCSPALDGSAATAASNLRTEVRKPLLTMRFRRFFFSLTFTRFFADWIFGNSVHLPLDDKKPSLRILSCIRANCKPFFPENITNYMPELRSEAPA